MAKASFRWTPACLTWLITSLFYSFQFFLRSAPNAMSQQLMMDFSITAKQIGVLVSAYYIPYSLLQIPIGICLDVWGPKKILRIGTLLCVAGAITFSYAYNFHVAYIGRVFIGMGAAVSFIGSIRMNTLWLPPAYLAFAVGLLSALGKLGSAASSALLPLMISHFSSWHSAVLGLSAWGFFLAIIIWVFAKNGPEDHFVSAVKKVSVNEIRHELFKVMKQPVVWLMGFYGYSLYLVLSVFSDAYSIAFLSQKLQITWEDAGKLAFWVPVGSAFGASFISYFSDLLKKRRLFLRLSAIMTLLLGSFLFFGTTLPLPATALCLFALGFFSGGQILIFVVSAESLPSRLAGMATGTTNALLMAGGALHSPLFGWILDTSQGQIKSNGTTIYTLSAYQTALFTIFACFVLAVIISFIIKESHPLAKHRAITIEE